MKKVSIIVPVYNVEKYIRKCLDSLVNQTLNDIEVIVVNDGSPDNSQSIIDEYVKKYPKIVKSYIKENGGQGSARNYGLERATGEYIGYVDSDDYVSLDMYETLYNKAKNDDADIVVCSHTVVYEANGNKIEEKLFNGTDDNRLNALFNNAGVCNKIYRKDILKKFNFRTKVWYEDIDFVSIILLLAKKISFVDSGLYYYLLRQGSTMNNSNIERNLEILDAFNNLIKYLHDYDLYDSYFDEITFLAVQHIYIAASVRVINTKNVSNKKKKEIINTLMQYMNNNFSKYNQNKYLYLLDKNKKIIYNLLRVKMYFLIKMIFDIKRRSTK